MKNKVLAVILATTMVLGLVACGAKEEAPAAAAPAATRRRRAQRASNRCCAPSHRAAR